MSTVGVGDVLNRPVGIRDSNNNVNQYSFNECAVQNDDGGGANLVYMAKARVGATTAQAVWQIRKLTYDASGNILTQTWPKNAAGIPSNDYEFIYDNRAAFTYA